MIEPDVNALVFQELRAIREAQRDQCSRLDAIQKTEREQGAQITALHRDVRHVGARVLEGERHEMADIDTLTSILTDDETNLGTLATDQGEIVTQLKALQGQTDPDLSGVIQAATALGTGIGTMDAAVKAALAGPAPAPAQTGGGTASGGGTATGS